MKEIACFVSPHGFGHATRAIAIVEAIQLTQPDIHAHFFTTVPKYLFKETLTNFSYHKVLVDIGLVQSSALDSNIPSTIEQLDKLHPFAKELINNLGDLCSKCSLILCDIAPIGIAVAQHTGLPSVLVENFTWDWIYQPYAHNYPKLKPHIQFLKNLFVQADYRIQTEPLCFPASRDLYCGPIFRRTKGNLKALREQLGYGDKKLVVVTMGGVFQQISSCQNIKSHPNIHFLFTGQQETKQIEENISLLALDSDIYHPDLLGIADVVVCKVGYSTVAECCQAGARVLSIGRADFPESDLLQRYLENRLGGVSVKPEMYLDGSWVALASELLLRPKAAAATKNGADQVADFLRKLT